MMATLTTTRMIMNAVFVETHESKLIIDGNLTDGSKVDVALTSLTLNVTTFPSTIPESKLGLREVPFNPFVKVKLQVNCSILAYSSNDCLAMLVSAVFNYFE